MSQIYKDIYFYTNGHNRYGIVQGLLQFINAKNSYSHLFLKMYVYMIIRCIVALLTSYYYLTLRLYFVSKSK